MKKFLKTLWNSDAPERLNINRNFCKLSKNAFTYFKRGKNVAEDDQLQIFNRHDPLLLLNIFLLNL